jgi:hypothetical protein
MTGSYHYRDFLKAYDAASYIEQWVVHLLSFRCPIPLLQDQEETRDP